MASSAPVELSGALWAGIARLRDISKLVLAEIERDDLDRVEGLVHEGEVLASRLKPLLDGAAELPTDIRATIEYITQAQGRMLETLVARKLEVARQLDMVRFSRARLRAVKMPEATERGSLLDRET